MKEQDDQRLKELKQKYQSALNMAQQLGIRLQNLHVQDNKLFIRGSAPSPEAKNRLWDQIKMVDPNYSDLTADITVEQSAQGQQQAQTAAASVSGGQGVRTYQVKQGDSLSKIAKEFYGNSNLYMRIFEANKDKLTDPNQIQPGQRLVIP